MKQSNGKCKSSHHHHHLCGCCVSQLIIHLSYFNSHMPCALLPMLGIFTWHIIHLQMLFGYSRSKFWTGLRWDVNKECTIHYLISLRSCCRKQYEDIVTEFGDRSVRVCWKVKSQSRLWVCNSLQVLRCYSNQLIRFKHRCSLLPSLPSRLLKWLLQ